MENNKKNAMEVIDLGKIAKTIWQRKKVYYKVLPVVFLLSVLWIFPEPRYYNCEVQLAPEVVGENVSGGLNSIASSFGFNLGSLGNSDAIYPMLYPDLFKSNEFIVDLLDIKVKTEDGTTNTDLYTYMKLHQKQNMLKKPFRDANLWIKKMLSNDEANNGIKGNNKINPFYLSMKDFGIVEAIKSNINCAVDKKTDVTTIIVQDQDRLVCATLADSIKQHLQDFIIRYRTSKARMDVEYYQKLASKAKKEYESATIAYATFSDSNTEAVLQSTISKRDELENDMSMKFNTYTAMNTQLQAMKAKVQERTPTFTVLKSATVPIKPAGPKRMLFVFAMLVVSFMITTLWISRKELHLNF